MMYKTFEISPSKPMQKGKKQSKLPDFDFVNVAILSFLILKNTKLFDLPLDIVRFIISKLLALCFVKRFDYEFDFDKNGILYFLGTRGLTEKYEVSAKIIIL